MIGTLQGTTSVLLVFFVFALIAVVIVRSIEARGGRSEAVGLPGGAPTL